MTSNQYRKAIAALNLSQVAAGRFLGIGARTSRRYALGESPIPHAVALLLRLMLRLKLEPEDVT